MEAKDITTSPVIAGVRRIEDNRLVFRDLPPMV